MSYESSLELRQTLQALANRLADAMTRCDLDAALRVLADPETSRKKLRSIFAKPARFRSFGKGDEE